MSDSVSHPSTPPPTDTQRRRWAWLARSRDDWKRHLLPHAFSAGLHLIALAVCAGIVIDSQYREQITGLVSVFEEGDSSPIVDQPLTLADNLIDDRAQGNVLQNVVDQIGDANTLVSVDVNDFAPGDAVLDAGQGLANINFGDNTSGRSAGARGALVKQFGGNSASEAAVAAGLAWLARHQLADGSWSFDHAEGPDCNGQCTQPGTMKECRIAATALALLSFLGAGHSTQQGDYRPQVSRGLEALVTRGQVTTQGALDLRGDLADDHRHAAMYSQGLATLALCEAYAMTKDEKLKSSALSAVAFIVAAQDPIDGGWRYELRQAGDTSVVGWQVMALKSAQNAGLDVPAKAFRGAERFLNTVQSDGGSRYGYPDAKDVRIATTAAGLLCRMYLGWTRRDGGLKRGVIYLDRTKPARNDMYYNYYATQVLHHWGGDEWTRWNDVLRDQLVATQHGPDRGHMAGSWDIADPHGSSGGRHYMTCLCVMTLEVYYRHLPLYQREKFKGAF
jgi:hypothetical protein